MSPGMYLEDRMQNDCVMIESLIIKKLLPISSNNQKWFDIINESDNNESLILAIEHAEAIYGLCRER
jgi:hypothetical protein